MEKPTNSDFTILIVDDHLQNIGILSPLLIEYGYSVDFSLSGEKAIKMTSNNNYDLILLDTMLSEMDGFEVCKKIKENSDWEIPVIFLTAKSGISNILKGFKYGGIDYITLPYNEEELLARIKTHLSRYKSNKTIKKQAEELSNANEMMLNAWRKVQNLIKNI
jgi:DNA-binding response OmpR family regulator